MKRIIVACLLCIAFLCGCSTSLLEGIQERTAPPDAQGSLAPISPSGGDVPTGSLYATLYYRYKNEPYLAPYLVQIPMTSDATMEKKIIEQLIQGPSGDRYNLAFLIDPKTRVLDIKQQYGHLEITLSSEFLNWTQENQDKWDATSEEYETERALRRRLAVYSIVNTITEMGKYSRVLILIAPSDGATAEKLTREQAGLDAQPSQSIDPLSRNVEVLLTADQTLQIAMTALIDKDWEKLYSWVALRDIDQSITPSSQEMRDTFLASPALVEYTIASGESVMLDGQQSTLCINAVFVDSMGNMRTYEDIPIRLVRSEETWMLSYPSLLAMVTTP